MLFGAGKRIFDTLYMRGMTLIIKAVGKIARFGSSFLHCQLGRSKNVQNFHGSNNIKMNFVNRIRNNRFSF